MDATDIIRMANDGEQTVWTYAQAIRVLAEHGFHLGLDDASLDAVTRRHDTLEALAASRMPSGDYSAAALLLWLGY